MAGVELELILPKLADQIVVREEGRHRQKSRRNVHEN